MIDPVTSFVLKDRQHLPICNWNEVLASRREFLRHGTALITMATAGGLSACATNGHGGPMSDHFDGERFFNPWEQQTADLRRFLEWRFNRDKTEWPTTVANPAPELPPERVGGGELRAGFVGHATVLLQTRDLNILTDPVWSQRVSPVSFIGPSRVREAGIPFDALPPIDVVTVSHNHYDHMDLPTLARLVAAHDPVILTPLNNGRIIRSAAPQARIVEMDWNDVVKVSHDVTVRAVPAQHWSSRSGFDRNKALWSGFVVESPDGPVYIAGDTGLGPHFEPEQRRYGGFRLALLPIGAYEPRWFMRYQHMNPDDATQAHDLLQTDHSLGVHFGTFQLTDEGLDAPVRALHTAREVRSISHERFRAYEPGEAWLLS
jgi:L-ascorbate metabolism protein UlaG (beta-lactamase superfamily)